MIAEAFDNNCDYGLASYEDHVKKTKAVRAALDKHSGEGFIGPMVELDPLEQNTEHLHDDSNVLNQGVKYDQGKPDYTLLPIRDLEGVVRVMEFGAKKYARDDWKRLPDGYRRYLAAHLRHMVEVLEEPKHIDSESGLLSFDHALCDLIFARRFLNEVE